MYHRIYRLQNIVYARQCGISCSHIFIQLFVSFLSVNGNEKNTVECREALRKNARDEEQGTINQTNVLLHKVCRST
jgi:hypothetical protein